MKPSEVCKAAGLKSLAELSEISSESVQTLNNWYKNEPRRFELVLKGALFERAVANLSAATTKPRDYFECAKCDFAGVTGDLLDGEACPKCKLI